MRTPFTLLALAALVLCAGCGQAKPGKPLAVGPVRKLPRSRSSHIVIIMMENAEFEQVIGAPAGRYVTTLARSGGVASNSFAIRHPSLPNYLALTSGSTHGVSSDCTSCIVGGENIVDQLERAGVSWRAYMEGLPHPCFMQSQAGGYAKKHDPFAYYRNIIDSPPRCRHIVGFEALAADLRDGRLPTYAWITPNLCDDGHDCGVAAGDRFLARTVPALLAELGPRGFLVLTWDEGTTDKGCCGVATGGRIPTILAGPDVRPGARDIEPVDTYGVLATIEQALGMPPLGAAADPHNGSLDPLFKSPPHIASPRAAQSTRRSALLNPRQAP
jgi:phosphatidylinositol-3-phosphatase